jgi:hypothetical protein
MIETIEAVAEAEEWFVAAPAASATKPTKAAVQIAIRRRVVAPQIAVSRLMDPKGGPPKCDFSRLGRLGTPLGARGYPKLPAWENQDNNRA